MATDIEWTRGDDGSKGETWNPTVGCSRLSPGCDRCYAIRVAAREMQEAHVGLTTRIDVEDGGPAAAGSEHTRIDWTGEVRLLPDRLDTPLHWRKPRRVFVDSMSDLFHADVPEEFIAQVFDTMRLAPQHTFQVLTKRPQRMAAVVPELYVYGSTGAYEINDADTDGRPLPNVWLGTSVENQRYADLRIPHLLATPAAVRFLSIEPLLGPVDLSAWFDCDLVGEGRTGRPQESGRATGTGRDERELRRAGTSPTGIGWVIVGGESGPGARPMHPDWVRSIRDQCVNAGVPFFFKQWGEWLPLSMREHLDLPESQREWRRYDTGESTSMEQTYPDHVDRVAVRVGKKAAGRQLDGRTWDEMPEPHDRKQ